MNNGKAMGLESARLGLKHCILDRSFCFSEPLSSIKQEPMPLPRPHHTHFLEMRYVTVTREALKTFLFE